MSRQMMLRHAGLAAFGFSLFAAVLFSWSALAFAESATGDEVTAQERVLRENIKKEFMQARREFNADNTSAARKEFEAAREEYMTVLTDIRADYKAARDAFLAEVRKPLPNRAERIRLAQRWKEKRRELFTDRCHALQSDDAPMKGFGAPWNPFSKSREMLIRAHCDPLSDDVAVDIGTGFSTQYIYQFGYVWRGDEWEKVELTSDGEKRGPWFIGDAAMDISFDDLSLEDDQYVVTYMCQWTGNLPAGGWKCGCSDEQCAIPRWNLQKLHRLDVPAEPDDMEDE